jgi:HlyD family secretion protein
MDRPLESSFVRIRSLKRVALATAFVVALGALGAYGPHLIRPSIAKARIRTAVVDTGPVEATITASGTVVPEFEGVVSSPLDARVTRILKRTGDVVRLGEPLLQLDDADAALAADKLEQDLALKQNQRSREQLELERTLRSIHSQWEIKNLELQSLQTASTRTKALFEKGVQSEDNVRKAERELATCAIELKQLEDSERSAEATTRSSIEALDVEIKTLTRARDEARRTLGLATTRADRVGVLTFVLSEEGATIQKGAVVARIADLGSFRVDATVSDMHAQRLAAGLPARVKIGDELLGARVAAILPAVQNGVMSFTVTLDDKASPLLKSNMRVDVLVTTDRTDKAVRVRKGPFANGDGVQQVFVIRGDHAIRTPVKLGIAGFDTFEVAEGLVPGDEVIISDMADYASAREIQIY